MERFRKILYPILVPLSCLSLAGCGYTVSALRSAGILPTDESNLISGQVKVGRNSASAACTQTVSLYRISSFGKRVTPALDSMIMKKDGSFSFDRERLGLKEKESVLVEVSGCGSVYGRLITGTKEQDITAGTALVAWLSNTTYGSALFSADLNKVARIYQELSQVEGLNEAYQRINSKSSLRQDFEQVFGVAPTVLLDASPRVLEYKIPSDLNEDETYNLNATVMHWNPNYNKYFKWKLDDEEIEAGLNKSNITFTPSENSQGKRVLSLHVGKSSGAGLDLSKPFFSVDVPITIANSVLPSPPTMTLFGVNPVNNPNITLVLTTGNSMRYCNSFSNLALTEDTDDAPTLASAYNITCSQSPTQNISFTLSSPGTGKVLRLWARDSSGTISTTVSTVSVDYVTVGPVVAITSPEADSYTKNSTLRVQGDCDSSVATVSVTGTGLASSATGNCTSGKFDVNVTLSSGQGAKALSVSQTDAYGQSGSASVSVNYDSIAPTVAIGSPASMSVHKSSVTLTGDCETGAGSGSGNLVFTGAGLQTSPTTRASACTSGTFSETLNLSSGDGNKVITVTQTDQAGNSGSASITLVRDDTKPTISISAPAAGSYVSGGQNFTITWTATDSNFGTTPITLEYSSDGGDNWSTISSSLSNSGSRVWAVPSLNTTRARVRVTATDAATNSDSSETNDFTIDSTNPSLSLTSLTGGQLLKGGASTAITWTSTDLNFGSSPISIDASSDAGATWSAIATDEANDSSFTWTIPSDNSSSYRVRVTAQDRAGRSSSAASSSSFAIDSEAPEVTLTKLKSGGVIPRNSSTQITWDASDTNFDTSPISVHFSNDGGVTWTLIQGPISNSGSINWKPSDSSAADGTNYRLKVTAVDKVGWSSSDASTVSFSVSSQAPNLNQTSITSPYYAPGTVNQITLGGECDLGAVMGPDKNVYITGDATASVSCTGSAPTGSWTYTTPIFNTDGTRTFTATQTNSINLSTSVTTTWTRDSVAPVVSITSPTANSYFNTSTVRVQGACDTSVDSVLVSGTGLDTAVTGNCTAGSYDVNVVLTTGVGSKTITVSQTDLAGLTGTASVSVNFDNAGPTLAITSPASMSAHQTSVTLVGTCESSASSGSGDLVFSGSGLATDPTTRAAACVSGAFSQTLNLSSGEGDKAITVTQTDATGNPGTASITVVRDQTPPTITISAPTGGSYISGNQDYTISWSATDSNIGSSPISLDYSSDAGTSWTSIATGLANTGSYSWRTPGINNSQVRVRATAIDSANNSASTSTTNFILDSSNPNVTLLSLTGGQLIKGGASYDINWTAVDANLGATPISLNVSTNGGVSWSSLAVDEANDGAYSWSVPLVNSSSYRLRVTATDRVGRSGSSSSSSSFSIDSSAPTVTLTSLKAGGVIPQASATQITWDASDANFGSAPILIYLSSDGGTNWSLLEGPRSNTGTFSWTPSSTSTTTGSNYRLRITAVDQVGWSTSDSSTSSFTISSQAPALTQTTLTSPYYSQGSVNQITIGGACDLGALMGADKNVYITGAATATVPCSGSAPSGTWTYTTANFNTDGTRTFTATQTNSLSISTSVSVTWTRDSVTPQLSSFSLNGNAQYAASTIATASVTLTETNLSGLQVRIKAAAANGDCQSVYANDSWLSQETTSKNHTINLTATDGTKKICVWARDRSGNVSVHSPTTGTLGVDMDTIEYQTGNAPQITTFNVVNNKAGANFGTSKFLAGDEVKVSWTITDVEGLDNNPVTLSYTTDNVTWTPIETDYGGLSGNPTSSTQDYYGFSAPTSSYFRLKMVVKDLVGNTSVPALSGSLNGGDWSIYAGSTDRGVGGTAKSASFYSIGISTGNMAIHPQTGDIYIIDKGSGINKIDATTGIVSRFISEGTFNLPNSGTLNSTHRINSNAIQVWFDKQGFLYLQTGSQSSTDARVGGKVYRIDLSTLAVRFYAGGGTVYDATATPSTVFILPGSLTFDEQNSMYFYTNCTPNSSPTSKRILKLTQNADGTAGSVSIMAGDCSSNNPTSGQIATSQGLGNTAFTMLSTIAAWDNGATIYFRMYQGGGFKLLESGGVRRIYSVNLSGITTSYSGGAFVYDASNNRLLVGNNNTLRAYTPNKSGANGETSLGTLIASSGTGDCTADGVLASAACVMPNYFSLSPSGQILFTDGINDTNTGRDYRIRYIDENNKIQTLAGGLPFYGNGFQRNLIRGRLAGIYYKKASEPNQGYYDEGLYFVEASGPVFGKISPAGVASVLWGDQSLRSISVANGSSVSAGTSMGLAQSGNMLGNGQAMTFDSQGRPWLKADFQVVQFSTTGTIQKLTSGSTSSDFSSFAAGTNPALASLGRHSAYQNFALKGSGLFLFGRFYNTALGATNPNPVMRFFDFSGSTITHVMGSDSVGTPTSDNSSGTADLSTSSFSSYCNNTSCAIRFEENNPAITTDDKLYFTEDYNLRVITNPLTPGSQALTTIMSYSGSRVDDFILSEDKKYILYIFNGSLYCLALQVADETAKCKATFASRVNLGPPAGFSTLARVSNSMTWKNSSTLYINNSKGEILEYSF